MHPWPIFAPAFEGIELFGPEGGDIREAALEDVYCVSDVFCRGRGATTIKLEVFGPPPFWGSGIGGFGCVFVYFCQLSPKFGGIIGFALCHEQSCFASNEIRPRPRRYLG